MTKPEPCRLVAACAFDIINDWSMGRFMALRAELYPHDLYLSFDVAWRLRTISTNDLLATGTLQDMCRHAYLRINPTPQEETRDKT